VSSTHVSDALLRHLRNQGERVPVSPVTVSAFVLLLPTLSARRRTDPLRAWWTLFLGLSWGEFSPLVTVPAGFFLCLPWGFQPLGEIPGVTAWLEPGGSLLFTARTCRWG
jgi:hypothetical protein